MSAKFKKILKCDVDTGKVLKVYTSRRELEDDDFSHNAIKVELCKQGGQALYKGFKWENHESISCEECGVECFNSQCKLNINGFCINENKNKKEDKIMEEEKVEMVEPKEETYVVKIEEDDDYSSIVPANQESKQSEKSEDSEKKESKLKVVDKTITLKGEYETYIVTATGVTIQNSNEITFCNESDIENYRKNMISMINNKADEMLQALSYR